MKSILITGGAGFIGSELVKQLYSAGEWNITVLDSMSEQIHGKDWTNSYLLKQIEDKCRFVKGIVTDIDVVLPLVKESDYIIHLAAETGTGQSMYEIERYNRVNVTGTAVLLDALMNNENNVQKIILSSSRAVYGEGKYVNSSSEFVYPNQRLSQQMEQGFFEMTDEEGEILQPFPTDENSKLHPVSFYGLTKLQQEQMLKLCCEIKALKYVILRYQNVYGDGQALRNPYTGILSVFSNQILRDKPINVFEDGLPSRDFIFIVDVDEATIRSLE